MVERLQDTETAEPRGVTFVDLDGTLLTGNSMHIFMRRLPRMLLGKRAVGAYMSCMWQLIMRSIRLKSHKSMKWHLMKTAREHIDDEDWNELAESLSGMVNQKVADYIRSRRDKGCLTYIATAAPEEYTFPLCHMLGYDGVLATSFSENFDDYEELNGDSKHEAIERLLLERGLRLESFLTDHSDDLPTAKAFPLLTILVGGSEKTAAAFREAGVTRYIN